LQVTISGEWRDQEENILLLQVNLKGTELILICIYGPNGNDPAFFNSLQDLIRLRRNLPIIITGDWNCTLSTDNVDSNIDCLNMRRLPNIMHSNLFAELCENFSLADPYRSLYSDRREYTYIPRNDARTNKSRLGFFLVTDSLAEVTTDCTISEVLQNKLFDHKAVSLMFNASITAGTTSERRMPTIK
jgi:exonuclease III